MSIKYAINGFGRIGRVVVRAALDHPQMELTGINDLTDAETLCHLLKYDSVHGRFKGEVHTDGTDLVINGKKVKVTAERDPANLPWKKTDTSVVMECTGVFTKKEKASLHLKAGAKKILISAPSPDCDHTIVLGVNDNTYDAANHNIISNGSCTTNCLAPVAKTLHESFSIKKGLITTIHSYTNDQKILDLPHKDMRRARAAALSMIPTSTGAAKAVSLVLPELKGKLDGMAVRVPTPNVSLVDLVCEVERDTTKEEVNEALTKASNGGLKNILYVADESLVSCDFNGSKASSTVDLDCTMVTQGNLVKVLAWYDNETGFSNRMVELATLVGEA